MNVLIIPSWYPDETDIVSGIFIKNQAEALAKCNHKVVVLNVKVNLARKNETKVDLLNKTNLLEVRVANKYIGHPEEALTRYLTLLEECYLGYLINFQPDIIHSQIAFPAGVGGSLLGKVYNKPNVITEHYGPFEHQLTKKRIEINNEAIKQLIKYAFDNTDRLIAVSDLHRKQILDTHITQREIDIIPNCVDNELFAIPPQKKSLKPINILFAGFITKDKGADLLIDAAIDLAKEKKDFILTLVGRGDLLEPLKAKVKLNHIDHQVKFTGAIEQRKLAKLMAESDFFVFPSLHETFGCILIEAAACGKPIVCSLTGVAGEIVSLETGLLINPSNPESLVEGMKKMMTDYPKYDAVKIRAGVQRFFAQSVVGQMVDLYKSVIERYNND